MNELFLKVLALDRTAIPVIVAVVLARALLRRAPRRWSYALWAVVGFRLCCPVSFAAAFSLFRLPGLSQASGGGDVSAVPAVLATVLPAAGGAPSAVTPVLPAAGAAAPVPLWLSVGSLVWVIGMAALAVWAVVSLLRLRARVATAVRWEGNVYLSEHVRSPFLLGLLRPRIYLPFGAEELGPVLAHERYHLRHGDHWVRLFAFVLLTVHWFDPFCWLAFWLMGRDMELRCDEAVLAEGGGDLRTQYGALLLGFAAPHGFPGPLAFGETGVAVRVRSALRWRRPRPWATAAAALLCVAVCAACAADPLDQPGQTGPADDTAVTVGSGTIWRHSLLSSGSPDYPLTPALDYGALTAECTEGALVRWDGTGTERTHQMTLGPGETVCWSPWGQEGVLVERDTIRLVFRDADGGTVLWDATVEVTLTGQGEDGWYTYHFSLSSDTGLYLTADRSGGGLIRPATLDTFVADAVHAACARFDDGAALLTEDYAVVSSRTSGDRTVVEVRAVCARFHARDGVPQELDRHALEGTMTFRQPEEGYLRCEQNGLAAVEAPAWDDTALYEGCYAQAAAYFSGS